MVWALTALGLAVAVVVIEHMWVTDNEQIESVVYKLRQAVLAANPEDVLAQLTIACYSAAISSERGNATGCHRGGIADRWPKPVAATQFVASRRKPICCGGGDLGNCIWA